MGRQTGQSAIVALAVAALLGVAACGDWTTSPPGATAPPVASETRIGAAAAEVSTAPAASPAAPAPDTSGGAGSTAATTASPLRAWLLPVGGLEARGTSGTILRVDPTAGTVTAVGHLARPVHDAAGASMGGGWLVVGGGVAVATSGVQRVVADSLHHASSMVVGALPMPRADGSAVATDGRVLLVGGGRGGVPDAAVLETRDGVHFSRFGTLAIPVRYGAVVAVAGAVLVLGGTTARGVTDAVQRIDLATGAVRVVGRLPFSITEASAFLLGGRVLLAGGMRSGRASAAILAYDPATGRLAPAGRLPEPVADAGVAVLGDAAYLVGGETATAYLDTVIAVR
ncbi:MAG TPA: hypothetical protein VMU14_16525 [Acidimicrobiales bacterium]|nr:hypothetical protein [Acidimicrobiales bacterium]